MTQALDASGPGEPTDREMLEAMAAHLREVRRISRRLAVGAADGRVLATRCCTAAIAEAWDVRLRD